MTSHLTKGSVEFLTIARETCKYMESEILQVNDFIDKMRKLLPLLYLRTSMVEPPKEFIYEDEPERFVTEKDYDEMQKRLAELFGEHDQYLTASHPDISMSDTPIAANISEDLTDLYQNLKDFVSAAEVGDEDLMNDALLICLNEFKNYWGTKLINAQLALHQLWCNESDQTPESIS